MIFANPCSQTMGMKCLNKITANIFSIYMQTNSPHRLQAYQTPDYIITLGKGHFQKCSRLPLGPPFGGRSWVSRSWTTVFSQLLLWIPCYFGTPGIVWLWISSFLSVYELLLEDLESAVGNVRIQCLSVFSLIQIKCVFVGVMKAGRYSVWWSCWGSWADTPALSLMPRQRPFGSLPVTALVAQCYTCRWQIGNRSGLYFLFGFLSCCLLNRSHWASWD